MCAVPPLSPNAAAGLLDGRPSAPRGPVRAEILHYGGGNPLALTELADAAASAAPTALRPDYRIALTGRLAGTFAPGLAGLPPATRRVLLVAAAAFEHDRLDDVLAAAGADLADGRPAEQAGLVSIIGGRLTFAHPTVRAVCYFAAPAAERHDAHARLAARLPAESGRRDRHVANTGTDSNDFMALAMERAAEAAARAGHGLEAAGLFERAADRSSDQRDAARRYGRAAAEADRCGDIEWSLDLWGRVIALTDNPVLLATAVAGIGNKLMFRPAGGTLALADRLLTGLRDPHLIDALLAVTARAVLTDGDPAGVRALRRLIERAGPTHSISASRALAEAVADPAGWAARHGPLRDSPLLRPLAGPAERVRLLSVGGVAWVLDDADIAIDHYRRALATVQADGSIGVSAAAGVAVTEVLFDLGLFDEAGRVLADAEDLIGGNPASPVRRAILAQRATLSVRRGDLSTARAILAEIGETGPEESRLVRYLIHRAAGRLAVADGDPDRALERYRRLFDDDGEPLHYLLSQRAVVALAGAAVDAGRGEQARILLRAARARAECPDDRRRWSWDAALALLEFDEDGEQRLRELLAEPRAAMQWPYEHAVTEMHIATALRARRRPIDARPFLLSALDAFLRQGAVQDAEAVRGMLRATGVRGQPAAGSSAFEQLTAQHQQIARLAARGLSNRTIAEHFGLSPRTIGFHLYQIYPKLGIARREDLRDVMPQEGN
jgi:DNA-binding CsgD family transcriptional regulator/tetratricopeptide (TPR) repeat protein